MAGYLDHPWNVVIWQDGIELLLAELARLPEALAPKAAQMLVPEPGGFWDWRIIPGDVSG